MSDASNLSALRELLRQLLSEEEWSLLRNGPTRLRDEDYDLVITRVSKRLRLLEAQIARCQERIEHRYAALVEESSARQRLLLDNSSPAMLVALTHSLIRQSFADRFSDVRRCLRQALLGSQVAEMACRFDYLSAEAKADLRAEAVAHVANAYRINSDCRRAEKALCEAEGQLTLGTGDRRLKATIIAFRSHLCHETGKLEAAARWEDKAIALWRLLNDSERLGRALLDRGRTSALMDSLDTTCRYLRESVTLLDDPRLMLVALFHLGERLAREGSAFAAWRAVCRADSVLTLMGGTDTQLVTRHRWVKALAFRASGELAAAESELMAVRRDLLSNELVVPSALASLDLASVYAAQQKTEEVKALAQECFAVFTSEGTDSDALVAFMTFYRAAQAETLTEALAVKVANFIARYQHNQSLRYEWSEE